eukprot:173819-Pleurochrysis_carterae.AAC.1
MRIFLRKCRQRATLAKTSEGDGTHARAREAAARTMSKNGEARPHFWRPYNAILLCSGCKRLLFALAPRACCARLAGGRRPPRKPRQHRCLRALCHRPMLIAGAQKRARTAHALDVLSRRRLLAACHAANI